MSTEPRHRGRSFETVRAQLETWETWAAQLRSMLEQLEAGAVDLGLSGRPKLVQRARAQLRAVEAVIVHEARS
jgi:hypothetical protein